MKIHTNRLIGRALDYMAAKAYGIHVQPSYHEWARATFSASGWSQTRIDQHLASVGPDFPFMRMGRGNPAPLPEYSSDWAISGPMIDQADIVFERVGANLEARLGTPENGQDWRMSGPNRLIASMRCLVGSQMGYEVDVPDVLLNADADAHEHFSNTDNDADRQAIAPSL